MPYLFPPILVTLLRLTSIPAEAPEPRLEMTALGQPARELAADVLVDADALADLVLLDRAAVFSLNLAGERHELRLELDDDGAVIGAAVWWIGEEPGIGHYDLGHVMPALAEAPALDAVLVREGTVILEAGGVRVPLGGERNDDDIVDVWDDDPYAVYVDEPGC
jgi:hypothetical protein